MGRNPAVVLFTERARLELEEARAWWDERGKVRALADAVASALAFIESFPEASPRVKLRGRWSTIRRVSVDPIEYYLYYRYDAGAERIVVKSFWHQHRRRPRL